MRVAVISDTHRREPDEFMERVYREHLADANALIHCGDVTGVALNRYFQQHPAYYAVAGNMDEYTLTDELPQKTSLVLNGFTIGVAHGWGAKEHLSTKVYASFGRGYDVICFGHTHIYEFIQFDETWLLNPGSLSGRGQLSPSLAYLYLEAGARPVAEQIFP